MIKVHHLETSRSTRLIWALEELGLEYELVEYKRHPKTRRAPDTAKSLHPWTVSALGDRRQGDCRIWRDFDLLGRAGG